MTISKRNRRLCALAYKIAERRAALATMSVTDYEQRASLRNRIALSEACELVTLGLPAVQRIASADYASVRSSGIAIQQKYGTYDSENWPL